MPAAWSDLDAIMSRLERHYADICDVGEHAGRVQSASRIARIEPT